MFSLVPAWRVSCVREQRIHACIRLRGLVVVLRLPVFFLNGVIKLHHHRAIRAMTGCQFVSPNQVIGCVNKNACGNQRRHNDAGDFFYRQLVFSSRIFCSWLFSRFNLQLHNNCRDGVAYACLGSLNVLASESQFKCRVIGPAADS